MRGARHLILPATALVLGGLFLDASPSYAQGMGMGTGDGTANEQPTRKTPAMSLRVYERLAEAQECSEMDDLVCANEKLQRSAIWTT